MNSPKLVWRQDSHWQHNWYNTNRNNRGCSEYSSGSCVFAPVANKVEHDMLRDQIILNAIFVTRVSTQSDSDSHVGQASL
jgi:hypothetical protein